MIWYECFERDSRRVSCSGGVVKENTYGTPRDAYTKLHLSECNPGQSRFLSVACIGTSCLTTDASCFHVFSYHSVEKDVVILRKVSQGQKIYR